MFLTQIVMQDLGAYKKMTGNLHLLIAHSWLHKVIHFLILIVRVSFCSYVQTTFNIPIGFLTESSGELGNKRNKAAIKKFSYNCNEQKQNFDVLSRRLWTSDPVLLYEQTFSQKIWSGRIRHLKPKIWWYNQLTECYTSWWPW